MAEMHQRSMVACDVISGQSETLCEFQSSVPRCESSITFAAGLCRAAMRCLAASAGGFPKQTNLIMECYKCCRISNT